MSRKYIELLNEVNKEHKEFETLNRDSKVLIVDGMNLFIRTFSAIPTQNEDGLHIGGLSGFLQSLAATTRMFSPTRVVVVFDGKGGSSKRREIYSEYKERRAIKSRLNRSAGFEDLADEQKAMKYQMLRLYYYLQELPVTTIMIDHVEADDVIAYLSDYFKEKVIIMSNDKDFLQLVTDRVNVYLPSKKKLYNPDSLMEEFGVWHENFTIFKALKGDKSDNIKSIKGFGDKTILKHFPQLSEKRKIDLEEFIEFCKLYDGKAEVMKNLQNNLEQFMTNYKLIQLIDVDIAGTTKSNLRGMVDSEIPKLNKVNLDMLCMTDKMHSVFKNWDSWLLQSFGSLNTFREKYATR